jgi:hypothetical protein
VGAITVAVAAGTYLASVDWFLVGERLAKDRESTQRERSREIA